ncbi:MAG: Hpt domain-containing protein [Phycisphaerales bacterium]|nr:Hpt domain-containing protein [bacterium]
MSESQFSSDGFPATRSNAVRVEPVRSSFANDPDMAELIEYFVDEVPQRLESLQAFCESGDREGVQRLAHQLKGASDGYGFEEIGLAAARVERPLKGEASLDDVRQQIDDLTELLRRVSY